MRNNKTHKRDRRDYEDEDGFRMSRKKEQQKRRPVRNWTKAWKEHREEDLEDFYGS